MVSFSVDPGSLSAVVRNTGESHFSTSIFHAIFDLSQSLKQMLSGHSISDISPQSLIPAFLISANKGKWVHDIGMGPGCLWGWHSHIFSSRCQGTVDNRQFHQQ